MINPFEKTLIMIRDGILDGWENAVTTLGTAYSAVTHHTVVDYAFRTTQELEGLYYADPFASRTVRDLPEAAFRQGWEVVPPPGLDPDDAEEQRLRIESKLWDLKARGKLLEAICWGRRDGRGAAWIGVDDGHAQDEQLAPEAVRKVIFLDVLEAQDFQAHRYFSDPLAPDFGEPAVWNVTRTGGGVSDLSQVHTSRLILFGSGIPTSRRRRAENEWRAASVLEAPFEMFRNLSLAMGMLVEFIATASQGILKIRNLAGILAEKKSVLETRLRIMDLARSIRVMPIDAGDDQGRGAEDFGYAERSALTGTSDVVLRLMGHLAGAVGEPQTALFGASPAGLNATGDADTRGWYDRVAAEREDTYRHAVEELVYLVAVAEGVDRPAEWGISWPSLWQESPAELAERQGKVATTDQAYLGAGVVTAEAVALARYGSGEWSDAAPQVDAEELAATSRAPRTGEELEAEETDLYAFFSGSRSDAIPEQDEIDAAWEAYHRAVNMSRSELEAWSETMCSHLASVDRGPVSRNVQLLGTPKSEWGKTEVRWARKTVGFIARMKAMPSGQPASKDCPSRRDIALKNWAYDPGKGR